MPRSCEESLAARAWASAHARQPPRPPSPQTLRRRYLRELLAQPGLRPVYYRTANTALDYGTAEDIEFEIRQLEHEITRATAARTQVQRAFPTLYPLLSCATASKPLS